MAMPPQFASKSKTPGKGMPPSKPGDKPNPFAKGKAPAKGKKGGNPFVKKGVKK